MMIKTLKNKSFQENINLLKDNFHYLVHTEWMFVYLIEKKISLLIRQKC